MERVMHSQEMNLLLRIFIGEHGHLMESPSTSRLFSRRANRASPGQLYCVVGHSSLLHTAKILRLSEDLPVIVEIVDTGETITAFLSLLEGMVKGGLVTLEEIRVVRYGPRQDKQD
jgi:uncharacterized protein